MEGVSRFCPQCRGYIRSEHLDEARSFRGELYHRQCILKHVLDAIGIKHDAAHGSIRFSLGKSTTKAELDYVVKELKGIIHSLRMLSPIHLNKGDIRKWKLSDINKIKLGFIQAK